MNAPTPAPKPKPPVTKAAAIEPTPAESTPAVKKPFVRKEHLTDRPLKNHVGLLELHQELTKIQPPKTGSRKQSQKRR